VCLEKKSDEGRKEITDGMKEGKVRRKEQSERRKWATKMGDEKEEQSEGVNAHTHTYTHTYIYS
jgi:hypothetical protein